MHDFVFILLYLVRLCSNCQARGNLISPNSKMQREGTNSWGAYQHIKGHAGLQAPLVPVTHFKIYVSILALLTSTHTPTYGLPSPSYSFSL